MSFLLCSLFETLACSELKRKRIQAQSYAIKRRHLAKT